MLSQLTAFIAALVVAAPVIVKFAAAIGGFGSAVEAVGLFLGKFSNSKVQAVGAFLVRVGKVLEAAGIDAPKVISNVLSGAKAVLEFLRRFGGAGSALAILVLVGLLCVSSCTAAEAQRNAETARDAVNKYCDARARALRDLSAAGSGGAP